jgi:hypothetical protein
MNDPNKRAEHIRRAHGYAAEAVAVIREPWELETPRAWRLTSAPNRPI